MTKRHYCTSDDCRVCQAAVERYELDRDAREAELDEEPEDCWPGHDR